jgi:hypothetical protein
MIFWVIGAFVQLVEALSDADRAFRRRSHVLAHRADRGPVLGCSWCAGEPGQVASDTVPLGT